MALTLRMMLGTAMTKVKGRHKMMLLYAVIVGEWGREPRESKSIQGFGRGFWLINSLVKDVKDHCIYVVQHSNQVYPAYFITYTFVKSLNNLLVKVFFGRIA